jgi:hypothetical protein
MKSIYFYNIYICMYVYNNNNKKKKEKCAKQTIYIYI